MVRYTLTTTAEIKKKKAQSNLPVPSFQYVQKKNGELKKDGLVNEGTFVFEEKKSTSFRKNQKTIEEVLGLQEEHLGRLTQLTLNINGNHTSMRL